MWLDGKPYWSGIQMDETAFPILLVDLAYREGVLKRDHQEQYWNMVRRAASYLLLNGPVTQEDRWEEDPGYSWPFNAPETRFISRMRRWHPPETLKSVTTRKGRRKPRHPRICSPDN